MTEKKGAAPRAEANTIPPPPADEMPAPEGVSPPPTTATMPSLYSPDDKGTDLVERLRSRHMPMGGAALQAGEIIKRREVSFDLDGVECEPDMFVNGAGEYITFRITLRSLSSTQEIEAIRGVKDGTEVPMRMARWSFYAINGKPLNENDRDFFWECLGQGGRQICLAAFSSLGAASEAGMGKYLSSRSEG